MHVVLVGGNLCWRTKRSDIKVWLCLCASQVFLVVGAEGLMMELGDGTMFKEQDTALQSGANAANVWLD